MCDKSIITIIKQIAVHATDIMITAQGTILFEFLKNFFFQTEER